MTPIEFGTLKVLHSVPGIVSQNEQRTGQVEEICSRIWKAFPSQGEEYSTRRAKKVLTLLIQRTGSGKVLYFSRVLLSITLEQRCDGSGGGVVTNKARL